ncbi:Na/Pi cotransporter family protein [Candidatus Woesearchaeota archaeon]|nr:Na/Pi cotransporter family protein [Candidatus Woesearchaeota archaeon]
MGDFSVVSLVFSILGGLGLFIYGIKMMGDGLQKIAGQKMRAIVSYLTDNRLMGAGIGALVTSIIQSSSATTVMLVGFVNAGIISLAQAIPIILGAAVGTTITAQLIAFNLTDYALPIIGVGAAMYLFGTRKRTKQLGESILGFGILFLGLNIMSLGVKPLGNSAAVKNSFTRFSRNPFLGILVGTIATAVIQSSSVSTGIILALAGVGLLDLRGAMPLVLGANIGTCVTALLASIGTNLSARRVAVAHIIFKVAGAFLALILWPLFIFLTVRSSTDLMRQIANFHTIFNITNAIIFIGFTPLFAKAMKKLMPGEEETMERGPKYLAKNLLNTPSLAIDAAKKEILRALRLARDMVKTSIESFYEGNRKSIQNVLTKEDALDELQEAITAYLVGITEKEISEKEASMIPALLHSINDIERIGDHAVNIAELAERKMDHKLKFTNGSLEEIQRVEAVVNEMIDGASDALSSLDKAKARGILSMEDKLNSLVVEYRTTHAERLKKGTCHHISSVVFIDMLMNFEKIGDHLVNIAQATEGKLQWNGNDA